MSYGGGEEKTALPHCFNEMRSIESIYLPTLNAYKYGLSFQRFLFCNTFIRIQLPNNRRVFDDGVWRRSPVQKRAAAGYMASRVGIFFQTETACGLTNFANNAGRTSREKGRLDAFKRAYAFSTNQCSVIDYENLHDNKVECVAWSYFIFSIYGFRSDRTYQIWVGPYPTRPKVGLKKKKDLNYLFRVVPRTIVGCRVIARPTGADFLYINR